MFRQLVAVGPLEKNNPKPMFSLSWLAGLASVAAAMGVLTVFYQQYDLFFAICHLIIIGMLSLIRPATGIFALLFLSATTGLWGRLALHFAGGQASPLDFVRFSLELCVLLFALLAIHQDGLVRNAPTKVMDYLILLYLLVSTLTALNILYVGPITTIWGWRWVCLPLLMYYVGRYIGLRSRGVQSFNQLSMWVLFLLSCLAIYQMEVGLLPFEITWLYQLSGVDRLGDVATEMPRVIGGELRVPSSMVGYYFLVSLVPFLFLVVLFMPRRDFAGFWRKSRLVVLTAGIIYLALSLERSAIGVVIIGLFLAASFKVWQRSRWVGIALLLILSLIGLGFLRGMIDLQGVPVQYRRVLELVDPLNAATVRWRMVNAWNTSVELAIRNPIGYGLGSHQGTRRNLAGGTFLAPHNIYLQILLEQGLAGLICFLMVIMRYTVEVLRCNYRTLRYSHTLSALTPVWGLLVLGFFNIPLDFPIGLYFWFAIGLYMAHLSRQEAFSYA